MKELYELDLYEITWDKKCVWVNPKKTTKIKRVSNVSLIFFKVKLFLL